MAGYISDVMVSVTINQSAAGDASTADLYSHVGRAAGISAADQQEKISILVSPFYTEQSSILPTTGVSPWVLYAALGGVIVFLLVLLAVLLIRGRISKRKAQPQPAAAAAEIPQPVQQQADIMEMEQPKRNSMELRQDIRKFLEENPEIAAQMVRNWLREGESK
ncbi:MAG: hypothetical protein V8R55_12260 [Dysosmobacter sp.]